MINFQYIFSQLICLKKILSVFLLAIILFAPACSENEKTRPQADIPVKTAIAVQKDVPEELTTIGTVEAYSTVNITSRVDGQVMKIHIKEGQQVTQGQLLIDIDNRPYQALLESAKSNLARDKVRLEKAKIDSQRYLELLQKDYVTKMQAEQAQADAQALEAVVKGDVAAVENARLNVDYCRITSPISGRAGAILVHEGNLVSANDNAKFLMVINQIQPVYVRFSIPEQRLPKIQFVSAGQCLKVLVSSPANTAVAEEGNLTFVDNAINSNTGTIDLKGTFENRDNTLWPGQFVNVTFILGTRPDSVVVPSAAIQMGQQGYFVFVVKNDLTVESKAVTLGPQVNQETVVEEGIAAGEQVVTDGQLRLIPGAKVVIKNDGESAEKKVP